MDHNNLPYQVVRSKRRKTAQIRVHAEKIEVRIPHWVTDKWVEQWVSERSEWINKKWNEVYKAAQLFKIQIEQGSFIPLLGKSYQLSWHTVGNTSVMLNDEIIQVSLSGKSSKPKEEQVKQKLEAWYKQRAEEYLTQRLDYWQQRMGLYSSSNKIKGYKRRWGCCSGTGQIALNWKLIFADDELIDYVVIHEIAHLQHMNHSKSFWLLVEQYCADWKRLRKELNNRAAWLQW
jgi:predicted metal-dependent hydrolase